MTDVKKDSFVYKLVRPWDNVACYIGKSCGKQSKRAYQHSRAGVNHSNIMLATFYKRAGVAGLRFEILRSDLTEHEAFELEIELIAQIGRKSLGLGPLCNLTDGGEGTTGALLAEEHKRKIGAAVTGIKRTPEGNAKNSASNKVAITDKEREKRRLRATGVKHSAERNLKRSLSNKITWTPEKCAEHSALMKARVTPELCEANRQRALGRRQSPETIAKRKATIARNKALRGAAK